MSIDYDPGLITTWTTNPAPKPGPLARLRDRLFGPDHTGAADTWSPANDLAAGVHHPDRIHPVSDDWLLSPASWHELHPAPEDVAVHGGVDDRTALIRRPIAAITSTGHYAVYDEHLGGLDPEPDDATPFHDAIARWAATGYPIDDQTTDTTGEKDQ